MMRHANPQTTLGICTQSVGANMLTAQGMIDEAIRGNALEMAATVMRSGNSKRCRKLFNLVAEGRIELPTLGL